MTELGSALFAITEEDLIKDHAAAIERMIEDDVVGDVETERLTQVAKAIRNVMYWHGQQYVTATLTGGNVVNFVPVSDKQNRQVFANVYNVYKSDGKKFIGAVSSRAPNAKALPDDDESEHNLSIASDVDGALRILRREWDANRCQKELGYHAWNTGPIFGLTTYTADGHKHGWDEEPIIELEDVDTGFGEMMQVPVPKGTERYPRGKVELTLASVLYVTIPYKSKKLADTPWLCYEYMEHKAQLKGLYGDLLKRHEDEYGRHEGNSSSSDAAVRAQRQEASPSANAEAWNDNYWRYSRYWVRPAMFSMIDKLIKREREDGKIEERKLAEILPEQFPDGLKITCVNGRIVAIDHEKLDDVWAVCKTGTGDHILSDPLGQDGIPIQDFTNNAVNYSEELILRTIPKTAVDSQMILKESIEGNDPLINEIIFVKRATGENMANMMAPFPQARMPDALVPFLSLLQNFRREITGVTEALFGGGVPSPTYRGEKQRRDQSMMEFAPFFDETQSFWEKAYANGIRQWAKYGSGSATVPGENGQGALTIDIASLAQDGWHIEAEEGLPMSHAEEVDRFLFLLNENNPEIIKKMGLLAPGNSGQVKKMLGLPGFKGPEELARQKAQHDIQRLLQEPPIEDIDPMTGEPLLLPSIPGDRFEDFPPDLFAQLYAEWCLVSQMDRQNNEPGYMNVRARGEQYKRWAEEILAAGAPPPDGGPPMEEEPPPMLPAGPPMGGPPPFDTGAEGIPEPHAFDSVDDRF